MKSDEKNSDVPKTIEKLSNVKAQRPTIKTKATTVNTETATTNPDSEGEESSDGSRSSGEEEEVEEGSDAEDEMIFGAWARVFFQARNERGSQQILPSHSPTFTSTRDSYLYITIDASNQILNLYPEEGNNHSPIIDPPIELKYFFAERLPNSQCCVALFMRNDDRLKRRYTFRFEFRNNVVHQPTRRIVQMERHGKMVKKFQNPQLMRNLNRAGVDMLSSHEDIEERKRLDEKKSQEMHSFYLGTLAELIKSASDDADAFIKIVNGATSSLTKKSSLLWFFAGDEMESDEDSDDDALYSSDEDSDDSDHANEGIEDTFQRIFASPSK